MQKTETFNVVYDKKDELIFAYGEGAAYPEHLYQHNGLANGVDGCANVTADHVAHFREQGYLVVHNAFSRAAVQAGLDGLLDLIAGKNGDFKGVMHEKKVRGVLVKTLPPEERQD